MPTILPTTSGDRQQQQQQRTPAPASLLDRAILQAPWNLLTAKLFRSVAVFFLESYLVQLFGVSLPLDRR